MRSKQTAATDPSSEDDPTRDVIRIMIAYQRGSLAAFDELFVDLSAETRNYLAYMSGDRARAAQLLEETFLQVHRVRATYLPPRPVKQWVFGIARNVYLRDRRGRWGRAGRKALPRPAVAGPPVPAPTTSFPSIDGLRMALALVPGDLRECLLLHHLWGFDYGEVAGLVGISSEAARLRSFRGMSILRQLRGATV